MRIETDVAIPTRVNTIKHDWPALFQRMQPGQSCVMPAAFKYVLGKACTDFNKAGLGQMSMRRIGDNELRLWRVK